MSISDLFDVSIRNSRMQPGGGFFCHREKRLLYTTTTNIGIWESIFGPGSRALTRFTIRQYFPPRIVCVIDASTFILKSQACCCCHKNKHNHHKHSKMLIGATPSRRYEVMSLWWRKPGCILLLGLLAIALSSFIPPLLYQRLEVVQQQQQQQEEVVGVDSSSSSSMEQQEETILMGQGEEVTPNSEEHTTEQHDEEIQNVSVVTGSRQDNDESAEPSPQSIPDVAWIMSYGGSVRIVVVVCLLYCYRSR